LRPGQSAQRRGWLYVCKAGVRGSIPLVSTTATRGNFDALIDAAWGDRVTPGAASTLVSQVWRLRRLLEPARGRRQTSNVLVNDAGGYRLIAGSRSVDSSLFADLAGEVGDLLAAGQASAAVARTDNADDVLHVRRGHARRSGAGPGGVRRFIAMCGRSYGWIGTGVSVTVAVARSRT
jgi:hypothetical protein